MAHGTPAPKPTPEVTFTEIPGRTKQPTIPTSQGDAEGTVYYPPQDLDTAPRPRLLRQRLRHLAHPQQDDLSATSISGQAARITPGRRRAARLQR
ncbi:hypothetical protein [Streptomyces phaeochromogenes]|uniref:hypothetical protein n=1 Tax=Streptomyces phaeochromogenes TaxID=1923 RepID=UPI002DD9ABD4|nr:hypothetical protein [Streptomyces phaeochromogenes]WRZ34468.1 hypothetical protein OG931_45430 [Streptomyces phaeochromogenes]